MSHYNINNEGTELVADNYFSHFLVVFNHETGEYEIDDDTLQAHFDDGSIAEDTGNWLRVSEASESVQHKDYLSYVALNQSLKLLNDIQKVLKDDE